MKCRVPLSFEQQMKHRDFSLSGPSTLGGTMDSESPRIFQTILWYMIHGILKGKKPLRLNKVNREYDTVYTKKWYNRYKYVFFCVCKKYDQRYFTYMYSDAICEVNVWHVRSEGNCNRINDTQSGAFWSYWYILIRTNTVT